MKGFNEVQYSQNFNAKEVTTCPECDRIIHDYDRTCSHCETEKELINIAKYEKALQLFERARALHELAESGNSPIYTELFCGEQLRQQDIKVYRALRNIFSRQIDKHS